jgi:hypothetical protein
MTGFNKTKNQLFNFFLKIAELPVIGHLICFFVVVIDIIRINKQGKKE